MRRASGAAVVVALALAAPGGTKALGGSDAAVAAAQDSQARAARPSPERDRSNLERGHDLFNDYGCGICHILRDAAAYGDVAPALDGNRDLTESLIIDRVTNGQANMPAFGTQLSPDDIAAIAAYVKHAAAK
jgi:mono/diheme cytochrome c family protein